MNVNYETQDLYLASALLTAGLKVNGVRTEGKKCIFVFQDRQDRQDLVKQYCNSDLQVTLSRYVDSLKNLKSLTFNF